MDDYGWFTTGMMVGIVVTIMFIIGLELMYQAHKEQILAWLKKHGTPPEDTK